MRRGLPVLLGTLASVVVGAIAHVRAGHLVIPDDVYFYLEIADRIYRGQGSTLNGLVDTNGYHPLWEALAVGARAVVGADPHLRIAAHLVMSELGTLAGVAMLYRASRVMGIIPLGPGLALTASFMLRSHLGSEMHVALPLLLLSVLLARRMLDDSDAPGMRGEVVFGLSLGLAVLGRLDNIFVACALGLVVAAPRSGEAPTRALQRALRVAGAAALLLLPYLAWNIAHFGHLVPVSGAVKSALHGTTPGAAPVARLGASGGMLVVASLASVAYWWRRRRTASGATMLALGLGAGLHGAYCALSYSAVWTWYFSGELAAVALTLEHVTVGLLDRLGGGRLRAGALVVGAGCVVATTGVAGLQYGRAADSPWYIEAAAMIDAHVPPGVAVATTCSPGSMAYFSHRPIFALDGLTGDFGWQSRAASEGLYPTLRALGVGYVISMGPESTELAHYVRRTERTGHGGEAPTFYGTIAADGTARSLRVGLFSPMVGREVGELRVDDDNLVARLAESRALGLWRLAPATAQVR